HEGGPRLSVSLLLSLRDGVTAARSVPEGVVFEGHGVRLSIRAEDPCLVDALLELAPPGRDEDQVAEEILSAGGGHSLAAWYYAIERLAQRGLVSRSVVSDGRRLATLRPVSTAPVILGRPDPVPPERRYRLSRFAYLRREEDTLVLESPMAHA